MINYYFSHFIKKNQTRPCPSRGGPSPGGQWWDGFSFFKFESPRIGPCGPCGTMDRPGLDRPGPDRFQITTIDQ
jgi:hypothetical protein